MATTDTLHTTAHAESLRDWLRDCPAISQDKRFGVDYLGDRPADYAVLSVPSTLAYRENILGLMVLQDIQTQNFVFSAKLPFSSDSQANSSNLSFYQSVVQWILDENAAGNFPAWDGGSIKAIVPTLTASIMEAGADTARYQIQIKVQYRINTTD